MTKFSVIIPVYNTEQYLNRCIDSILTYQGDEIEIIAVDDGSTDRSLAILQAYRDPRLKIFHKENEGVFKTWKRGVSLASGEYIIFVDSDDYVSGQLFLELGRILETGDYDLIQYDWIKWRGTKQQSIEEPYPEFPEGAYCGERLLQYKNACIYKNTMPERFAASRARWGKVFRADKLKALLPRLMENVRMFEDDSAVIPYLLEMQSLYLLRKPLYYYLIGRQGSVCNSSDRIEEYYHDVGAVSEFLSASEFKIPQETLDKFYFYYYRFVLWMAVLAKQDAIAGQIVDDERFSALLSAEKGFKNYLFRKKKFGIYRFLRKLKHLL